MWTELHHTLGFFALGTPVGSLAPGSWQETAEEKQQRSPYTQLFCSSTRLWFVHHSPRLANLMLLNSNQKQYT